MREITDSQRDYPSSVRDEIENWISWAWDGESPEPREPDRCYSAERSYRVLNSNSEEDDEIPPKIVINVERAQRVQAIFERMPELTRRVLQYEYTLRSRYDIWERSVEMHEGKIRPVWVRVDNNKRFRARLDLKITRGQYGQCVDDFKLEVFKEFEVEVCA